MQLIEEKIDPFGDGVKKDHMTPLGTGLDINYNFSKINHKINTLYIKYIGCIFMIMINKKRMTLIIMVLFVSIASYTVTVKKNDVVTTSSLPVTNKVIVLDAGHGQPDSGASSNNGITEEAINLKITQKVQSLLEQSGSTVILTRSDENGIYNADSDSLRNKKVSDIKNRVKIGNSSSADIFVSIHLNKIEQSQYYGWQTFFKQGNEESQKLAQNIQNSLNNSIQKENKREPLKITGKYIIDHVEIPTTIVECGFLSNPEEEKSLQDDNYQNRLAWGIYTGIMDYFYENK